MIAKVRTLTVCQILVTCRVFQKIYLLQELPIKLPEKNLFPSLEPIEGQKVEEEFDKITDESKLDSLLSKEPSKLDEILESSNHAPQTTVTVSFCIEKKHITFRCLA